MDSIQPVVKASLIKAYKQGNNTHIATTANLIYLLGINKALNKWIIAMTQIIQENLTKK